MTVLWSLLITLLFWNVVYHDIKNQSVPWSPCAMCKGLLQGLLHATCEKATLSAGLFCKVVEDAGVHTAGHSFLAAVAGDRARGPLGYARMSTVAAGAPRTAHIREETGGH